MVKLTPPMGWNSWNTFGENINEKLIMETADKMVEQGLLDCGYEYLVIDDCWSLRKRDEEGRLIADPEKFPHGMKAVADYVLSLIHILQTVPQRMAVRSAGQNTSREYSLPASCFCGCLR